MSKFINISSDDFILFANKLEKIGKADMPVAVRSTLNQLAFRMKGSGGQRGEIDKQAEKDFDFRRNKTLFRVMTGVEKASGLNVANMQSKAGIVKKSGRDQLAEGLAQQQQGGNTKQKATPLDAARTGRTVSKRVRRPARLRNLNSIDLRTKKKGKFIGGAIRAHKERRTIVVSGRGGSIVIARVRKINRTRGSIDIKMDWLYKINPSGQVKLKKARPFVNSAALNVMQKMPQEFKKQAQRRIEKSLKR